MPGTPTIRMREADARKCFASPVHGACARSSRSPKVTMKVTSWPAGHGERVRIHVPRVAQLTTIRTPPLGGREAACGQRHLFGNCRGHRLLTALAKVSKRRIPA